MDKQLASMKRVLSRSSAARSLLLMSLVAGGMLLASCTDLTEAPTSEITQANFNPTAEDVPSLVAPVYTPLRGFMGCCYSFIGMQDEAADMAIKPARPNGWGGPYLPYHRHQWTPVHAYVGTYNTFFGGVNAANRVIYQIESGTVPVEDPLRTQVLAELRASRAFYYFLLMDNYGNVPIVTDFTLEDAPEQSSRQEVYDFVVDELTSSIPDLREEASQATYGRFNRWAGMMVLAEVYLNAGVYAGDGDPGDGQNGEWEEVLRITNDIIDSGLYQLEPEYGANFTRDNPSSEEIILSIPYDEVEAGGNTFHMQTLTPEIGAAYQMEATPWGGGAAQPQFAQSYDEDDGRLEDTWISGEVQGPQGDSLAYYYLNIPSIEFAAFPQGWRIGKYEIYEGMPVSSDVDLPLYRYAETLMMKAEALLRMGRAAEAAEIVTQVRQRSFSNDEARVTASDLQQPSVVNWGYWGESGEVVEPGTGPDIRYGRFMDELGWEFAMEGHRRQDMIRFGAFTTKTWMNHRASESGGWARIFPLPESAINTNPNLTQNPGYGGG